MPGRDFAVFGNELLRYTPGEHGYAIVDSEVAGGRPVDAGYGRTAWSVPLSAFESVFQLYTKRLVDGAAEVVEFDPVAGLLSEVPVVQVRWMAPLGGVWPQFPAVHVGGLPVGGFEPVRDATIDAVRAAAPAGWRRVKVSCHAIGYGMEIVAEVTGADGETRSWSPPAMVGQWFHRWRMRAYEAIWGTWYSMSYELTPDEVVESAALIEGPPPSLLGAVGDGADELRMLPRQPQVVPEWMAAAAVAVVGRDQVNGWHPHPDPDAGRVDLAPVFDHGTQWYRPMVSSREATAVLRYLREAPVVLAARGYGPDALADKRDQVPMAYHTDGRWVWPAAVAYYLEEHKVPPVLALVDHIRQNRYRLPDVVPAAAQDRALAAVTGQDTVSDADRREAVKTVQEAVLLCRTSPRFFSLEAHRSGAWCLVRDGDWWLVYRASGDHRVDPVRFGDARSAAAYLVGQLVIHRDAQVYTVDEPLHWWQVSTAVLGHEDPSLSQFEDIRVTVIADVELERYGSTGGNLLVPPDTQPHRVAATGTDPHHRYRLKGSWHVVAATHPSGAEAYLLPESVQAFLDRGDLVERVPEVPKPLAPNSFSPTRAITPPRPGTAPGGSTPSGAARSSASSGPLAFGPSGPGVPPPSAPGGPSSGPGRQALPGSGAARSSTPSAPNPLGPSSPGTPVPARPAPPVPNPLAPPGGSWPSAPSVPVVHGPSGSSWPSGAPALSTPAVPPPFPTPSTPGHAQPPPAFPAPPVAPAGFPPPPGPGIPSPPSASPVPVPGHPGLPPISDGLRQEARRTPNGWVYCADPDIDPRYVEGVPNAALLGAYRVGPHGDLTGETYLNPDYRPSPRKQGFPPPLCDFDAVVAFVAVGWSPQRHVPHAALEATVYLDTPPGPVNFTFMPDGRRYLDAYTAPEHLPPHAVHAVQTTTRNLLPILNGATLRLNQGGRLSIEIPAEDLIAADLATRR
ncbi:type VII secretion system-associated protein [Actinokineospora auranticolor]|uniref:type VII secretion system-associated protein n=1 Tax=Actinokineospora auranticolor TaxID=155976 RepID=UPI000CEC122F